MPPAVLGLVLAAHAGLVALALVGASGGEGPTDPATRLGAALHRRARRGRLTDVDVVGLAAAWGVDLDSAFRAADESRLAATPTRRRPAR